MPSLPYVSFCFIYIRFVCLCCILLFFDFRIYTLCTSKLHHKKRGLLSLFLLSFYVFSDPINLL
nr:MAG TPA: hypothetical protein [Caudoviricetes sp.]